MQERQVFATPEGCDLVVKNVRGSITVEGWDRPETEVLVVKHQEGAQVSIQQEGRQITVKTQWEEGWGGLLGLFLGGRNFNIDYTVHVPHNSQLRLSNVNGPIQVRGIQGDVRANNVDGSTSLQSISGHLAVETVNGSLKIADVSGQAELKAVNGRLEAQSGCLNSLRSETVNGEIVIGSVLTPGGHYALNTVNGSARLAIPAGVRARVSAHGINSGLDCSLPCSDMHKSVGSWTGTVGSGDGPAAEVSFNTVNGRLHVTGGEGEWAASPVPPVPPVPPAEPVIVKVVDAPTPPAPPETQGPSSQAQVLQMLERGEISVDKALELLKNFD